MSSLLLASGSELGFSIEMVLVASVGYPLGGSVGIFIGLELAKYFGT